MTTLEKLHTAERANVITQRFIKSMNQFIEFCVDDDEIAIATELRDDVLYEIYSLDDNIFIAEFKNDSLQDIFMWFGRIFKKRKTERKSQNIQKGIA